MGVGFASINEALDLTTPAGRAMVGMLAVFAEFEREILRNRVRRTSLRVDCSANHTDGQRRRIAAGVEICQVPFRQAIFGPRRGGGIVRCGWRAVRHRQLLFVAAGRGAGCGRRHP